MWTGDVSALKAGCRIPSENSQSPLRWYLFVCLLVLPITNFPMGAAILREFGSRPVNIFLLPMAGIVFFGGIVPGVSRKFIAILLLFSFLSVINGFIFINTDNLIWQWRDPMVSWGFQALMLFWSFSVVLFWTAFLDKSKIFDRGFIVFILFMTIVCLVHSLFFLNDLARSVGGIEIIPRVFVDFIAEATTLRPSGLDSEPSHFGSWCAFSWPVLLLADKDRCGRALKICARLVGILVLICGALSFARTFIVLLGLQIVALTLYRGISSKKILNRNFFQVLICGILFGYLVYYFWDYINVFNIGTDQSSTSRSGATIAAMRMFLDHPVYGVGLGNFTSYYPSYIPNFVLPSPEASTEVEIISSIRENTSNLPARVAAELGLPALFCFLAFAGYPLLVALRSKISRSGKEVAVLCWVGGVLEWLSQDEIGSSVSLFAIGYCLAAGAAGRETYSSPWVPRLRAWLRRQRWRNLLLGVAGIASLSIIALIPPLWAVRSSPIIYGTQRLLIVREAPKLAISDRLVTLGAPALPKRLFSILRTDSAALAILDDLASAGVACNELLDDMVCNAATGTAGQKRDGAVARVALRDHFRIIRILAEKQSREPVLKLITQAKTPRAAQALADVVENASNRFLLQELSEDITVMDKFLKSKISEAGSLEIRDRLIGHLLTAETEFGTKLNEAPLLSGIGMTLPALIWPNPTEMIAYYLFDELLFFVFLVCSLFFIRALLRGGMLGEVRT